MLKWFYQSKIGSILMRKCDAAHQRGRGPCRSYNVSHSLLWQLSMLAMFFIVLLIVSWNKSFERLWFCRLKVGISLIVHNQNINKRWLALTVIMVMKWDSSARSFWCAACNFIFRNPARNCTIIIVYCVNNRQCIGYFLLYKKIDELISKNGSTENRTRVTCFTGVYLY